MNGDFMAGALILLTGVNMLIGIVCLWRVSNADARAATRMSLVESRVAKLEIYQQTNLTHAETRQIYERLSSIEGQIQTTNRLMQTVQEHLLEND